MIRKKSDVGSSALPRLEQLHTAGTPITMVLNDEIVFTIEDAGSFQRLAELIDRLEAIEGINNGLRSFERGEGRPAREALEELRRKHQKPRKR